MAAGLVVTLLSVQDERKQMMKSNIWLRVVGNTSSDWLNWLLININIVYIDDMLLIHYTAVKLPVACKHKYVQFV